MTKKYDIELVEKIRELANYGNGSRKISSELNISRDIIRNIFKKYGISTGNVYKKPIDVKDKVREQTNNKFRYVRGFQSVDKDMIIACNICNVERKANATFLRRKKIVQCYNCNEVNRAIKQELQSKEAFELKIHRYIIASGIKIKIFANECSYCGHKSIDKKIKKYCSKRCCTKAGSLNKSDTRRKRIESNGYKENVTLPVLFKRDKGVCHICKGKCDYSDYQIIDGHFCSGGNYPSRDHVIPLSKGGTHTWDNIKLAHFKCNTMKNDTHDLVMEKNKIRLNV
jgi:5-methylcytosine-specific restriction endonuclease McrA